MQTVKIAEGAYFVPSYSVQTLTKSYSRTTVEQTLLVAQDASEEEYVAFEEHEDRPSHTWRS